jgi:hypothetical protein
MAIEGAPLLDGLRRFETACGLAASMPEPIGCGLAQSGLPLGLLARSSKVDDVTHGVLAHRLC